MIPRLGVNIDHVATLRQARGEEYPSLVEAAVSSIESGADQITIHLREDRRHIQDTDVPAIQAVTKRYGVPLNLEIGANDQIIEIAIETKPDWICLVPEKREEKTTEGGLNLKDEATFKKIQQTCLKLKKEIESCKISLFVEADEGILKRACECKVDAVEIHTGEYAKSFLTGENLSEYFTEFTMAKQFIQSHGISFHAGHGLTQESVMPLLQQNLFEEYNIGHWIIAKSIFDGLKSTIKNLKQTITEHEVKEI